MKPISLTALTVLIAVVAGCGGDEVTSSNRDIAHEALIVAKDLPGRVKVEGGLPPEPCGPVEIFEANQGRFAETKMFNFGGIRVQEAVGVFPREGLSGLAFKALISRGHRACIRATTATFGQPRDRVNVFSPKKLEVGEESAIFHLRVIGPNSVEHGRVAVPSIRLGRCVSALIVFTRDGERLAKGVSRVLASAERALVRAC